MGPGLAAGCTLVIKPSPETVLDAYLLAEAAVAAGVPDGVISIVPGGRELGAYLVSHPGVDKVAFTGSTAGGRAVAQACAGLLRPVSLELGGKSAAIVLDDADLDLAKVGQSLFGATLANNGQVCFLGTRVLAPRSRYDEVVDAFAALMSGAPVGDSLDESTLIGPMASRAQQDRVHGYIERGSRRRRPRGRRRRRPARRAGPRLVRSPDRCSPTSTTTPRSPAEEIFGPVLSVIPYGDDAEAIAIANDSDYGLGGSVWSTDPERATSRRERRADRHDRHQRLPPRPAGAVRRRQGQRHRQGVRARGPGRVPESQVGLPVRLIVLFGPMTASGSAFRAM